jgi:hypothetical protein
MTCTRFTGPACLAGLLLVANVAGAQIAFFGVGDLPGGTVYSEVRDATRVGNTIHAVGTSSANAADGDTAFLWTTTGGIVALPQVVPGLVQTNALIASAITPDAAYIASRARSNEFNPFVREAVRVTASGLTNLALGFLPGFEFSAANAISSDGAVLYGFARYTNTPIGRNQAVRFTAAGPTVTPIPLLNPTDTSSAPAGRGTSADGSVMVGTSTNDNVLVNFYGFGNRAFRYVHGVGVSAIPLLTGGDWNMPLAVSPNGNLTLVAGNSTSAPNGEAYLHNATSDTVTPLGTPGAGWDMANVGGMTPDGSVIAATFGDSVDPVIGGFVRNASGWHDVTTIMTNAGIDLTGWSAISVNGLSTDGTLVWGAAVRNGNPEGWVAQFPAGYLAAYGASFPAQSIAGAWSSADTTQDDSSVVVFLKNGTYFHVADARDASAPQEVDGYERGTYTWNPVSGEFTLTTLVNTDGDWGASEVSGLPGMSVGLLGKNLTLIIPGSPEGPVTLPQTVGASPIVGAWLLGDSTRSDSSVVVVFFPNGTYMLADDRGTSDPGSPGMERGTYTWNPGTGAFTATTITDTNGTRGFSDLAASATLAIAGNTLTLTGSGGSPLAFARVVADALTPAHAVAMSERAHGAAGLFDLVLAGGPTSPTVEPRSGGAGGAHTVVFTFDKAVVAADVSVTEGTATAGTPTFNGSRIFVPLSGVANEQYVTVAVTNVTAADGGTGGSASKRIGFLLGDVNQSRVVTVSDLALVNAQIAQVVSPSNYLRDVNASGTLTVSDKGVANTQITNALPLP